MLSPKQALRPLVLAALLAAAPTTLMAQTQANDMASAEPPTASLPTVNPHTNALTEAIANAQSGAALLRARLEEEKIRAELEELMKNRKGGGSASLTSTGISAGGAGGLDMGMSAPIVEDIPPPHLLAIYGTDKRLVASVRYRSGVTQDIQPGETIDGGYTVSSIRANGVTLTRDGVKHVLSTFPGRAATTTASAQPATQAVNPASPGAQRYPTPSYPTPPAGAIRR